MFKDLRISSTQLVIVAEWLARLTGMWEVSQSNLPSYLYWNMHVRKWPAVMLAIKRSAGVESQWMYIMHASAKWKLPSANKAAHPGFETQRGHHQKSKTGVSVAP